MQVNNSLKIWENNHSGPLYIHGIGCFYPENIIDNAFLENLDIGTSNDWILERVGIRTRRTVLPLDYIKMTKNKDPRMANEAAMYRNAETGKIAVERALHAAKLKKEDIGLLIAGGCSPPYLIPADACIIANELNLNVPCFDLNSACSTFVAQLHFLSGMALQNLPDYVLLVLVENTTRTVNYADRNSAVLWGDASVAIIVSKHHFSRLRLVKSIFQTDPEKWDKVIIPQGKHFHQQGPAVQTYAIRRSIETANTLIQEDASQLMPQVKFIGHQGNLLMLQSICQRLAIPSTNHFFNVDQYGNCGAAGAPSVLSQHWDTFIKGNDTILMTIAGSGFSWGGLLLQFSN